MTTNLGMRVGFSGVMALSLLACSGASEQEELGKLRENLVSTWTPLNNPLPGFLQTCLLLTDGRAMCHQFLTNQWHFLTPDISGSYANGTWSLAAPMPNGTELPFCNNCPYTPLFFASAVLPDGRVVVIGGEHMANQSFVWTSIGFLYDPVADTWSTQLVEQFGAPRIGDSSSMVLEDGTFLLSDIKSGNVESLDLPTLTFTALNPPGKLDPSQESNWNILYDGSILTVNATIPASFERYDPVANSWGNSGSTVVNLADTADLGGSIEVGPGVLRPDGTLLYFSGNSTGQNAIYDTATNTWTGNAATDFPLVPGQTHHYSVADGPASLLPNGNVLVMASPVINGSPFNTPSHFYEVDLATDTLAAVTDPPNAPSFTSFHGRMLLLPTGEVLLTAFNQIATQDVMLYTNGGSPEDAWRPTITVPPPSDIVPGNTYSISGTLFNGFSEGASYGDDAQMSTNYPLVRITNQATGHVFYARTHDHSHMGVERVGSTEVLTTQFDVPAGLEPGPSSLVVVVNGIESEPFIINDNHPPIARCQDVAVEAGGSCTVAVPSGSVNNGSSDPDGDPIVCVLAPPGPFGVGSTAVTLTCTDPDGASSSCSAFVRVGVGNNQNCCPAGTNRILGNSNNNVLTGTAGADCIIGFGAQDTINGNGGNDIISGGDGDDLMSGGTGNDLIFGGSGQDRLNGNAGFDTLAGGDGDDQCFGGDNDDALVGGQGQDRLFGDAGNDRLTGNGGDDRLEGGTGDDFLDGSGLHDQCIGGPGTDTFLICENQTQ